MPEPRRFIVRVEIPRALYDDEVARDFFAENLWREYVRIAGAEPADDPFIRAITSLPEHGELMVTMHIIGYVMPAIPEYTIEDVMPEVPVFQPLESFSVELEGTFYTGAIERLFGIDIPAGPVPEQEFIDNNYQPHQRIDTRPSDDESFQHAMHWTYEEGNML